MATRWCLFSLLGPGHYPGSTSSTLCSAEMAAVGLTRALLFPGARRQLWDFTERFLVGGRMGRVRFFPLARERAGPLSPDSTRRTGVTGTRLGRWRRRCTPPPHAPTEWSGLSLSTGICGAPGGLGRFTLAGAGLDLVTRCAWPASDVRDDPGYRPLSPQLLRSHYKECGLIT